MRDPLVILGNSVCRRIWLAGVAINVMRWLELLAFSLFTLAATGSPFWVALTGFARLVPLLFGGVTSALVDGYDRRRVMLAVMATLTLTDMAMLGLALFGHINVNWLLLASLIAGMAWSVENSIRRTMLADAAGPDHMSESMGLEAASNQATRALGPAIGGALIATIGLTGVFVLGSILHGLGYWAMCQLPEKLAGSPGHRVSILAMMQDGFAYVRRHRLIQGSLAVTFIFNMWGFPYVSLAPVIGERIFEMSPFGIGLLLATEATGGLVCAILIMLWASPRIYVPLYSLGALGFISGVMTLGFWQSALPAFPILFFAGFGMAAFNAMQVTIPLLASPNELKVRVMGLITVCIGAGPIGFIHAGLLAEWLGAQNAQLVIGFEGIAAMFWVLYRWPELLKAVVPRPA